MLPQLVASKLASGWLNVDVAYGICTLKASGQDDAPAFAAVLASKKCKTVTIPKKTTLSIQSPLNTTKTYNKHINLEGTISYSNNVSYWNHAAYRIAYQNSSTFWFPGGENILLNGGGVIQANGQWNFLVTDSHNVAFDKIYLYANSTNPSILAKNTDGWDTYRSDTISIKNSVVYNGDDCVSFKPNSTRIVVDNLLCVGSHGISVGSLGQYSGEYDIVQDVRVTNVRMANAQNGIRIKSWAGPNVGSGKVDSIYYNEWQGDNIDYPIIIDTCYMTTAANCSAYPSRVPTSNVFLSNVNGTSSGKKRGLVVDLACSPGNQSCTNIHLDNASSAL